jgi:2,4-dienoyl-CoA reductase-like NADH-dependent reductase (Old Yellow Enzyme family)
METDMEETAHSLRLRFSHCYFITTSISGVIKSTRCATRDPPCGRCGRVGNRRDQMCAVNDSDLMQQPLTFPHGPAMRNRFMLAPLTNLQDNTDGTSTPEGRRFLQMRAAGGFGITMTCAAHVQQVGQGFARQLGAFGDEHIEGLTQLAHGLNSAGTVSYLQLHHAGNRAPAELVGAQPVCPSDDPSTGARALTTAEVEQLVNDFVAAARRAQRAGFHGVELHGAHGYLLCQFLSADINTRTDQFGGSLENRSRVLFDIIDGIRKECGDDLAVGVRLSPERFGIDLHEMCAVFERLADDGKVDLIDMSLWDVDRVPEDASTGGRTLTEAFATLHRGDTRLAVAGKIHTPADVRRVLDAGVDIAVLGRVAILHHDYPLRASEASFTPRAAPVTRAVLADEGVSPHFVEYLSSSFRMVSDA